MNKIKNIYNFFNLKIEHKNHYALCYISFLFIFFIILTVTENYAKADISIFIIDENSLPYNLSPNNYNNWPGNYQNSNMNDANNNLNYNNSNMNFENSHLNFKNGINGRRRLISTDNIFLGYYTIGDNGIINFFSTKGDRIAYNPGESDTQSVFVHEKEGWCGTLGIANNKIALGLTKKCYLLFLL